MIIKQRGFAGSQFLLWLLVLVNTAGIGYYYYNTQIKAKEIPNLIGTWSGINETVSEEKGYKTWDNKTVTITEQKDRRFRGTFIYADGVKNFFGVIYPDNKSFTWVSTPSHGFVHGRILDDNSIGACYVETFENAIAGCATLTRQ
ncbi:MAG TPA: hypothetical protein ENI26_13955 [Methylophaga aminisulfidivorans]|uniref:Uncharacterized protein n=2 Tax=root TaxID=1 RepID=A0A7C1ZVQ2_9GAMM|nr:hypothetical protein [Methylophaga aminisulfidivorans]HEC75449.1 hypothetical protein [Methylophaga aminisulfidivorans]